MFCGTNSMIVNSGTDYTACPYSEFSFPYFRVFGLITEQKNFEYGHFLRSVTLGTPLNGCL